MHIMKEKKPPKSSKPVAPPKTRKIRALKDEDIEIWGQATKHVTKYAAPNINKDHIPKALKRHYGQQDLQNIAGTITLETFGGASPSPPIIHHPSSFQVDAALQKRFEKGDLPIDGKIDLHGMTLAEAHRRFTQFISRKINEGARFLLVVTGKGSAENTGVIRKNLPLWCDDQNLKPFILKLREAQQKHGGGGATYILLRRQK